MFSTQKLVKSLISKIKKTETDVLKYLQDGQIEQESSVTDWLSSIMQYVLNGTNIAGIKWTVKTLTDRGRNSQESEFGADFLAAFEVAIDGFQIAKGFLAQSKLIEPSQSFSSKEAARLKRQCEKMLYHSSASFVFLYSQQSGICVIPAIEIIAARDCNPHELTKKRIYQFYQEHFECFIGDRKIRRANPQTLQELRSLSQLEEENNLQELRRTYEARRIILLSGYPEDEGGQLRLPI
ncbi:MAG: hypothetical protein AB4290_11240 [Spirulina sp.]